MLLINYRCDVHTGNGLSSHDTLMLLTLQSCQFIAEREHLYINTRKIDLIKSIHSLNTTGIHILVCYFKRSPLIIMCFIFVGSAESDEFV